MTVSVIFVLLLVARVLHKMDRELRQRHSMTFEIFIRQTETRLS